MGGVQSAAGRKLGRCACDLQGCGAKWSGTTEPRLGRAKRFPALSFSLAVLSAMVVFVQLAYVIGKMVGRLQGLVAI